MLGILSGRTHRVITGVCLRTAADLLSFADETIVHFRSLTAEEIAYYVERHRHWTRRGVWRAGLDRLRGVDRIEGSFYNVMGLPLHRAHRASRSWPPPQQTDVPPVFPHRAQANPAPAASRRTRLPDGNPHPTLPGRVPVNTMRPQRSNTSSSQAWARPPSSPEPHTSL